MPCARLGVLTGLRGRLALSYALVAFVSVGVAGVCSAAALHEFMLESLERTVLIEAQLIADDMRFQLTRADAAKIAARLTRVDPITDVGILVVDAAGRPLAATSDPAPVDPRPTDDRLTAALAGQVSSSTVVDPARPNERVQATVPIVAASGQVIGAVRASLTMQDVGAILGRVYAVILLPAVLAVVLAGGLGLRLAASVARPVGDVAGAATALAARRPVHRLPEPSAGPAEVRALVAAFNGLADRLVEFERVRGEFAADVSHELRSLASAMQTAAEALQQGVYTSEPALGEALVAGLVGHTHRLSRLATDLLGLARLEGGRMSVDREDVDLGDVLRSVQNEWLAEAHRRGITLRCEVPPTALPLRGDADRLVQAIGNLVENALKYAGAGGRVEVVARASGPGYEVAVHDSGPGIPAAARSRVFDREFRVEGRSGAGPGGMGLGLAIARGIAAAHDGDLRVETPPGGGARVVLSLVGDVAGRGRRPAHPVS